MKAFTLLTTAMVIAGLNTPLQALAADAGRKAEVAQRGAEVMPFSLQSTTHLFTKSANGGSQRVIAKNLSDEVQIRLIRTHLREIQAEFQHGDFSAPDRIHGADMPGLSQLRAAKPGQISIAYRDVDGGGELVFRSASGKLVSALHAWFDAQISDHGADAMDGHMAHHPGMAQPGSE
ncbi:aspartate carbamoyltransferase [Paraburkholderia aromaticivorans]|uniref:Aspartate carbamoyltransferase n=1 Tax=Paraburkholderia aromaticivorans TaxID=2026199 RepID=A0A248VDI8_9BURK|nr:aspartate carbamoyltransferase [Paraburkholderia aromaticivorans]ASV97048.1 aspartate carbamoyltransferase [Paraburkholderia aromaticivorans]